MRVTVLLLASVLFACAPASAQDWDHYTSRNMVSKVDFPAPAEGCRRRRSSRIRRGPAGQGVHGGPRSRALQGDGRGLYAGAAASSTRMPRSKRARRTMLTSARAG